MIKALLCDEQVLLSANIGELQALLAHIEVYKLAFVLLTSPKDRLSDLQIRLASVSLLANLQQFSFITHNENCHFERNDPAFFTEILARVGIEPTEALLMTSHIADIEIGNIVGISGFYITKTDISSAKYFGTLDQFLSLCGDKSWSDCFLPLALTPTMIIPQLVGNIGALRGLLSNIQPAFWHQHPYPQEWSPYQIVCHLMESEQTVQRPRLERILAEDNPFLSEKTIPATPQCQMPSQALVSLFCTIRQETIQWLENLPNSVWERKARHSIFGPTTFLEMAHFTAQHDRLHLNQLCQTLQKCK